jgi:hypothetical protein
VTGGSSAHESLCTQPEGHQAVGDCRKISQIFVDIRLLSNILNLVLATLVPEDSRFAVTGGDGHSSNRLAKTYLHIS